MLQLLFEIKAVLLSARVESALLVKGGEAKNQDYFVIS